jgi:hypothetical protein
MSGSRHSKKPGINGPDPKWPDDDWQRDPDPEVREKDIEEDDDAWAERLFIECERENGGPLDCGDPDDRGKVPKRVMDACLRKMKHAWDARVSHKKYHNHKPRDNSSEHVKSRLLVAAIVEDVCKRLNIGFKV